MNRPEQGLQRQVADYLRWALEPPATFTSIPAGGGGELRGKILKGTGYRAGTPDLIVLHAGHAYFIELKAKGGALSPAQRETLALIINAGCPVAVCKSLDAVIAQLIAWSIPLRESKPSPVHALTQALQSSADAVINQEVERTPAALPS